MTKIEFFVCTTCMQLEYIANNRGQHLNHLNYSYFHSYHKHTLTSKLVNEETELGQTLNYKYCFLFKYSY